MKQMKWIFMCLASLLLAENIPAQTREEKKAEWQANIEKRITGKHFKIDVSMAYPMRGSSIPLTTPYSLELKQDSADVYLPYFGRAYSVPYGGGKGLHFRSPVTDFNTKKKKKGYVVSFTTETEEDTYDFFIDIADEGAASISVTMRNRQSIRYSGEIACEDE